MTKDDSVIFEHQETKQAVRPARQWRNRWVTSRTQFWSDAPPDGPGEFFGSGIFPSRDAAETKANEELKRRDIRGHGIGYLGAEPVP